MNESTIQHIGQYEILEEIGRGGMATVCRAYQPGIEREVAIKLLPHQFTSDPTFLARFQREVQVAARLQHPRILPVYDFGEHEGQPYLVMAYLPTSLAERIAAYPNGMPLKEAIRIVTQLAEGLDHLHAQGIVHRDFKPSNVLLDAAGDCYLADFGIAQVQEATAHLTGTGLLGTPQYMAPEMFVKGEAVPQTDVYALGVTLFEMLTGQRPFESDLPAALMRAHLEARVPDVRKLRPELPEGVQAAIENAMAKDPRQRYQTAGEIVAALKQAVAGSARPVRRGSWMVAGIGVMVALVMLAGGGYILSQDNAPPNAAPTSIPQSPAALPTAASAPTDSPTVLPTPTAAPTATPIPTVGGGTGIIGFNANGLGYTVDADCVITGRPGCDPTPHILPEINGITPSFGRWSPDGKRIAFANAGSLYIVNADGSELVQINTWGIDPGWSPDGSQIVFAGNPNDATGYASQIWIVDLPCPDTNGSDCLTRINADNHTRSFWPDWAPSGNSIVYFSIFTGYPQAFRYDVESHTIQDLRVAGSMLSWSQDSGLLVFNLSGSRQSDPYPYPELGEGAALYSADSGTFVMEIKSCVNRNGRQPHDPCPQHRIGGTYEAVLSPDGRYIAFTAIRDQNEDTDVYYVRLDAPNFFYRITNNTTDDVAPSWSPDGRYLAFITLETTNTNINFASTNWPTRSSGGDIYILTFRGDDNPITRVTFLRSVDWRTAFYPRVSLHWQPAPP